MTYRAPVEDALFILENVVDYDRVCASDKFAEADFVTVAAVLQEAGKLSSDVIAPLNRGGDLTPARLDGDVVRTSPGFGAAFTEIAEGGWIGMLARPDNGGMGLAAFGGLGGQ